MDDLGDDRKNCPICDKFSKGPCGTLFTEWLKCTDDHPGKNPNNPDEDLHLSKCSEFAKALANCLEENESYYEKLDHQISTAGDATEEDDSVDSDAEEDLQQAWERLVQEDLNDIPRKPFPSTNKPKLEFRPKDRLAVIYFNLRDILVEDSNNNKSLSLLLVFVQDSKNNPQQLLSAGSIQDLYLLGDNDQGILQCTVPKSTNQLVVSALYESTQQDDSNDDEATTSSNRNDEDDEQIIYTYTARIPHQ